MRAPLLRQVSRFFIYQDPFRTETISDPRRLYLRSIIDISRTRVLFLPQLIYYSIFIDIEAIIPNYISLQGNSSDSLLSRISTWGISNLHVDIFYFPRGRDSFPPKFHFIPPKFHFIPPRNFLFPTWGFRDIHVEITFSRHSPVSICSQL